MLTIVVAQITAADPPLRIVIDRRGWTDGTRAVYHYRVIVDGRTVLSGDDLRGPAVGSATTLRAAAASLASFLAAAGESLARRGEASEYWPAYDPDTREFLAATYERFAQLGHTMTSPTRTDGRNPMPAPHRRAELRRPAAAPTRALRTVDGHRRPHRSAPRPAEPQHERK